MRSRAGALLLGASLLLVGCTADPEVVATPPSLSSTPAPPLASPDVSTTPSTEPSSSASVNTEEAAVLAAYRAFYAAVDQAQADPPNSQTYLEPVATGDQFEITNGGIKAGFLAGEEDLGSPVLNPVVHSIDGDTAVLHDCQDTSTVQTRSVATGEALTVGTNPSSATTVLKQTDGVWKVSATEFPPDPAAYCS